jgi:hypothetical protein
LERWERWEKRQRGRQRERKREMTVPGSWTTITSENIAHKMWRVTSVSTKDKGMGLRTIGMGYGLKVKQV